MNRGAGRKRISGVHYGSTSANRIFRIHAYSLMDNHYHLLIGTPLPNFSRAMRHLNGVRALQYRFPRLDPNCSHGHYLGTRETTPWMATDLALSYFAPQNPGAPERFDEFVREGVSPSLEKILARKRWPAVLGFKEFVTEIRERFQLARPPHTEKPQEKEMVVPTKIHPSSVLPGIAQAL